MGRLQGRTAVITGAGSGIGRAASFIFSREGASIVCVDRADSVSETVVMVGQAGGKAVALQGDAGDESFVKSYVERALSEYGSLDVVWANAGISGDTNAGMLARLDQAVPEGTKIVLLGAIGGTFNARRLGQGDQKAEFASIVARLRSRGKSRFTAF